MSAAHDEVRLFQPLELRELRLRNRVVVSPMCQYSAHDGVVTDWHLVHLGKFAAGGAGLVFAEAAAVEARGRITHGDLGIWSDAHVAPLRRITEFIKSQGAVPAMQIAHAGRKASMQRPWHGNGPMDAGDATRGEQPWTIVAPSPVPIDDGWIVPHALDVDEIRGIQRAFGRAAERALAAGFEVIELHSAHGYLSHSFLSPLTNRRNDAYGGDREGRMRFTLESAETIRAVWPEEKPMFVRISSVDGVDGGWALEDSIALARELKARGVDVIDCSSGGIAGSATAARIRREPGFQVPFAEAIRREAGIRTMAVGLIMEPRQAEEIVRGEQADLVALAREMLFDPNWPLHAAIELGVDPDYESWPVQYGWWLVRRAAMLALPKEA